MSEDPNSSLPAIVGSTPDSRDVLCADEVALWLGVNRKTVYNSAARGNLPCQRLGKRLLFSRDALVAWLAGRPLATGSAVSP